MHVVDRFVIGLSMTPKKNQPLFHRKILLSPTHKKNRGGPQKVIMTVLEDRFKKAVWLIRNGPPQKDTSNATKLKFYQYYKQATEGDVTGSQPWAVQVEARAKWEAWNSVKGMSKEDAMHRYIDLLMQDDPNWEQHPALANFSG